MASGGEVASLSDDGWKNVDQSSFVVLARCGIICPEEMV
jgi:hypothetical protein